MKMYKTDIWSYGSPITEVEVERVSDKSIWIKGNRRSKISSYECYFDTLNEAKEHSKNHFESKARICEADLQRYNQRLLDILNYKENKQ